MFHCSISLDTNYITSSTCPINHMPLQPHAIAATGHSNHMPRGTASKCHIDYVVHESRGKIATHHINHVAEHPDAAPHRCVATLYSPSCLQVSLAPLRTSPTFRRTTFQLRGESEASSFYAHMASEKRRCVK